MTTTRTSTPKTFKVFCNGFSNQQWCGEVSASTKAEAKATAREQARQSFRFPGRVTVAHCTEVSK